MKHIRDNTVVEFPYEEIFTRYGVCRELVTNRGAQLTSNSIAAMREEYNIRHKKSTIGFRPFELVYGKNAVMQIEFEHKTLRIAIELGMDLSEVQKERIVELNQLDGLRKSSLQNTILIQHHCVKWHDKYIITKAFHVSDWTLLYDSRYKDNLGKLQTWWLERVFANGAVKLATTDIARFKLLLNGHHLHLYYKPSTKEEFMLQFEGLCNPPAATDSDPLGSPSI
ncbi:uncharacterized protein LOC131858155 [Cryptomeria japonica]|uniref:uncharacterized protein LOC131858155 n=1 Tax=Cryptomeria japonica TaxID=3369 RepID=UPI0027DAA476|nr:uncharacterized protein LOC131858155 [Cryptomeria japonica]